MTYITKEKIEEVTKKTFFLKNVPLFFYSGNIEILEKPCIAIVGSRKPTLYGRQQAHRFAKALAQEGFCIVSGAALGIDAIAQQAALDAGGCSIAVIGSGLNFLYPPSNDALFRSLLRTDRGLILTEFEHDTPPQKWTFPKRNLTIAALAHFVLVVEASERSGSLITANAALEWGIDVGAIPGCIDSSNSSGTNGLIEQGAFCIQSPRDILLRCKTL